MLTAKKQNTKIKHKTIGMASECLNRRRIQSAPQIYILLGS
jgi:hypothetical protein